LVPRRTGLAAALRPPQQDRRGRLWAHRLRQNEERLRSAAWRDVGLVFPNRIGGPTDHNNLYYREYKPLLKRAGLAGESFTCHTLRHTFATVLFSRGQHPKVVQSLLGHSSITQTMDTYSHLMDGMGGNAVDTLERALS
jgi:integrase